FRPARLAPRFILGDDRLDINLHHPFRPRQALHDEAGRAGIDALQPLADLLIDRLAIGAVRDVDRNLADMRELAAGFLQQLLDVAHRLLGLLPRIADADHVAPEVLPDLPAQKDVVAGAHGHAEVVVELLLWIGLLRIELAQPR